MIRWRLMQLFAWFAGKCIGYAAWRGRYGTRVGKVGLWSLRVARRFGERAKSGLWHGSIVDRSTQLPCGTYWRGGHWCKGCSGKTRDDG